MPPLGTCWCLGEPFRSCYVQFHAPPRSEVQRARVQLGGRLCVAARSTGLLDFVCRACTPAGALAAVSEGLLLGSQCSSELQGAARPCAAGRSGRRPDTLSTSIGLHMQPRHACSRVGTGSAAVIAGIPCHFRKPTAQQPTCASSSQLLTDACTRCKHAIHSSAGLAGTARMPSRAVLQRRRPAVTQSRLQASVWLPC